MRGLWLQLDRLCSQSWSSPCWLLSKLVQKAGLPCVHLPPADEKAPGIFQPNQDLHCSGAIEDDGVPPQVLQPAVQNYQDDREENVVD